MAVRVPVDRIQGGDGGCSQSMLLAMRASRMRQNARFFVMVRTREGFLTSARCLSDRCRRGLVACGKGDPDALRAGMPRVFVSRGVFFLKACREGTGRVQREVFFPNRLLMTVIVWLAEKPRQDDAVALLFVDIVLALAVLGTCFMLPLSKCCKEHLPSQEHTPLIESPEVAIRVVYPDASSDPTCKATAGA